MDSVQVIAPGSEVFLGGEIRAKVLEVTLLEGGSVVYKVCWWGGTDRNEQIVYPCEVQTEETTRFVNFGFRPPGD